MAMDTTEERDRRRLVELEREMLVLQHTVRALAHRITDLERPPVPRRFTDSVIRARLGE